MKVGDLVGDVEDSWLGLAVVLEFDSHNEQAKLHWFCNNNQCWVHASYLKVVSEVSDESR